MKGIGCIAAAVFQLSVLGYMAGEREWILHTGRIIQLRTAPLDPIDPMRGAYVRLDYPISRVVRPQCRDGLADTNLPVHEFKRDLPVYAVLEVDEAGFGELRHLTDRRPVDGPFLRGRLNRSWGESFQVRYGLEALFTQQERARELEHERWGERRDVTMIVDVAVGANGTGVLKGWRWDTLGVAVNLRPPAPARGGAGVQTNAPAGAEVVIKNYGESDVAIVDLPENRSFALLVEKSWGASEWRWVGRELAPPAPQPAHVVVLNPGESHTNRIDFSDPAWFVTGAGTNSTPRPVATLTNDWDVRFRFEYRPPNAASCRNLPNAGLVSHGRRPSRAFSIRTGRVD